MSLAQPPGWNMPIFPRKGIRPRSLARLRSVSSSSRLRGLPTEAARGPRTGVNPRNHDRSWSPPWSRWSHQRQNRSLFRSARALWHLLLVRWSSVRRSSDRPSLPRPSLRQSST